MKSVFTILFALPAVILFQGCNKTFAEEKNTAFLTFDPNGRDTINFTDGNGNKQGHWITFAEPLPCNDPKPEMKKSSSSLRHCKIEEGIYIDNKKEGPWNYYYSDGSLKYRIEYKADVCIRIQ